MAKCKCNILKPFVVFPILLEQFHSKQVHFSFKDYSIIIFLFFQVQQQLAHEFEQLRSIQSTLNSFKSDNHTDRPVGPARTVAPYEEFSGGPLHPFSQHLQQHHPDPDVWGSPHPRDPDVWPSPTPAEHRAAPPVRSRPGLNKKADPPGKPPPSRGGGKPPSGAAGAGASGSGGRKLESRFSRTQGNKDDKTGTSKSAPAKGKDAAGKAGTGGSEENKDEKIVEEDNQERRFDGSGYDKDLVEMLGTIYPFIFRKKSSFGFHVFSIFSTLF